MGKLLKINDTIAIFSIFFLVLLLSIIKGPEFLPDSGSYESNSIVRIGMYPMIINFFKFLFKSYAFKCLVVFQTVFALSTVHLLTQFLRDKFKLPFYSYLAILCVFLFPVISHASESLILSESISYPLFLLTTLFFFKLIIYNKSLYNILFVSSLFLLCFTRQQFVFFYVVGFIYALYLIVFEKKWAFARQIFLTTALSLGSFFILERCYHAVYHGHFAGTPFVGTQLLMRPLFVASSDALQSIEDPKQKLFISEVVEELTKREIISPNTPPKELFAYEYFYNTMYHKISSRVWGKIWSKEVLDKEFNKDHSDFEILQIIDRNALIIAINLVRSNFIATSIYYLKDTMRGMGGYSYCCFIFIILLSCFVGLYNNKNENLLYLLTTCAIVMHLGNSSFVCLFEPPITRYVYPTSSLLLAMAVIFFTKVFYSHMQNKKLCAE